MSYCRFSEGDVYAYACEGGVQFWVAGGINQLDRLCNTYNSAYQYAKYLRDEGFDVPSHAIDALRADALDELNHGDGSAVAELVAENAKSREQVTRLQADWESERDYADQMEAKEKRAVAENAKLRKLVQSMYVATLICCGDCWLSVPHDPAMCGNDNCGHRKNYLAMQELGIEFKGDGWMSRALYEMTERMDDLGMPHD